MFGTTFKIKKQELNAELGRTFLLSNIILQIVCEYYRILLLYYRLCICLSPQCSVCFIALANVRAQSVNVIVSTKAMNGDEDVDLTLLFKDSAKGGGAEKTDKPDAAAASKVNR